MCKLEGRMFRCHYELIGILGQMRHATTIIACENGLNTFPFPRWVLRD